MICSFFYFLSLNKPIPNARRGRDVARHVSETRQCRVSTERVRRGPQHQGSRMAPPLRNLGWQHARFSRAGVVDSHGFSAQPGAKFCPGGFAPTRQAPLRNWMSLGCKRVAQSSGGSILFRWSESQPILRVEQAKRSRPIGNPGQIRYSCAVPPRLRAYLLLGGRIFKAVPELLCPIRCAEAVGK